MKTYELNYLILPETSEEGINALVSDITGYITKEGGSIVRSDMPTPKSLGYQIKGKTSAISVVAEFFLDSEKIKGLEEKMRKEVNILRFMLTEKKPVRIETRERRIRPQADAPKIEETPKTVEKKVELKDIDEKLDEILKD